MGHAEGSPRARIARRGTAALAAFALAALAPAGALAFDSGSTGADGALNYQGQTGVKVFDPVALGLDTDADNIYNFTTINIPSGVTVQVRANKMRAPGPVYFLASGAITIAGILDFNGSPGHGCNELHQASIPGPGGYAGGIGGRVLGGKGGPGDGPGGGEGGFQGGGNVNSIYGAGGSNQTRGGSGGVDLIGFPWPGPTYGNLFLIPLVGGSGGGGGAGNSQVGGTGGGAGGGAALIASSVSITLTSGSIQAIGGATTTTGCLGTFGYGGGGSGGALYVLAPDILGTGSIYAYGNGSVYSGGTGWTRVDAFNLSTGIGFSPTPYRSTPVLVLMPTDVTERTLRVQSVGGETVPDNPTGTFVVPDVAINTASPVQFVIKGVNVPTNATVKVFLNSTDDDDQELTATFSSGTEADSTWTASATVPSGGTTCFVKGTWAP